jgi:hypothetical protein
MPNFDQPHTPPIELTPEQIDATIEFKTAESEILKEQTFATELLIKAYEEALAQVETSQG